MKKYLQPDDLSRLKTLIVQKSWWDSVDALVKTIGYLVHKNPDLKSEMAAWSSSDNVWLKRTSMIHQLGMKGQTDTISSIREWVGSCVIMRKPTKLGWKIS